LPAPPPAEPAPAQPAPAQPAPAQPVPAQLVPDQLVPDQLVPDQPVPFEPVPFEPTPPADRPMRADARRNRERLLVTARAAFAAATDPVSIEGIARDAGVGIGTLYRHFPTREDLVEAVYAAELDDLTAAAPALLREAEAQTALRRWMDRYARFAATKRGMVDTLHAGRASGRITTPATRERLTGAIALILAAGRRDGSLRADVDPDDVTVLLLAVFLGTAANSTPDQTCRLIDLVLDALRPGQKATGQTATGQTATGQNGGRPGK
jgi:AcrR family transcriptional regulator